jgi:hypothetical protein
MNDAYPRPMRARRIWLARGIAVAADFVQIAVFPLFSEGMLSPLNVALDVLVCGLLIVLVGWHIAYRARPCDQKEAILMRRPPLAYRAAHGQREQHICPPRPARG